MKSLAADRYRNSEYLFHPYNLIVGELFDLEISEGMQYEFWNYVAKYAEEKINSTI